MGSERIKNLEMKVKMTPTDFEAWYELGKAYHEEMEWLKAFDCFQHAEVVILENIGEELKRRGSIESAQVYFRRAQRAERRQLKLAPTGSNWLQTVLIVTGTIALFSTIILFILWPSFQFLIPLLILLFDLLVFMMLLPIAIVKHATSRKKTDEEFQLKLQLIENQINAIVNQEDIPEIQKFIQIGRLKQKRAKFAWERVRYEYSESFERGK
ncbi:MAG: hypothetical protein HWN66_09310 [Candidatus Helarchaeota archaeon]|nr:hypothetical protein [Candidatus Helarchaeota archaeon]